MTLADRKTVETQAMMQRAAQKIMSRLPMTGADAVIAFMDSVTDDVCRLERERDVAVEALKLVRSIISDGAETGFNGQSGDWAERLFASQSVTHAALRAIEEGRK